MRILTIGEVGNKMGGDRPREHCNAVGEPITK